MLEKLNAILGNDEGMEGVQAAGLVLVAVLIIAVLILFKDKIVGFFTKSATSVDQMNNAIPADILNTP